MAAHHPTGATQLRSVMAGDGVIVPAVKAVHSDAVAAMLPAGAVAIASIPEIQADVGASPR